MTLRAFYTRQPARTFTAQRPDGGYRHGGRDRDQRLIRRSIVHPRWPLLLRHSPACPGHLRRRGEMAGTSPTMMIEQGPCSARPSAPARAPSHVSWPTGGAGTAVTENGRGGCAHIMAGAGPPSTPCDVEPDQGVDGGPAAAMTQTGHDV